MVSRYLLTFYVWANRTPRGGKSQNMGVLGHFGLGRPLALRETPGPGRYRKKHKFPVQGVPKRKRNVTTLFGMVVCDFLTFYVLADQTPRGGKSRNTGMLGHFGPRRPLALRQVPGRGRKRKNAISRCQGHFWGGNPDAPKVSPQKCATFLHFTFRPTGPPRVSNCKIRGFWAILAYGSPWYIEKFRVEDRKAQTATLRPKRDNRTPFSSVLIPSLDWG